MKLGKQISGFVKLLSKSLALLFNYSRDLGWVDFKSLLGSGIRVLSPGDAPFPANRTSDYLDYRGIARQRELGALMQDGISLGRYLHPRGRKGRALSIPIEILQRNCAVIGPPGSGKTEGVIIPWIIELLGRRASVVTCDVKGDLIDRLGPEAQRLGCRLWYWNSSDPKRSLSWNWMDGLVDHRDIEAATQSILGRPRPNDTQPFFYDRDYRWLRTMIGIVKAAYKHTAQPRYLYALVGDQVALRNLFKQCPQIHSQASELADLLQFSTDEHSRAVSGLLNALHLFNTAAIAQVTTRSDFALSDIGSVPTLFIIGASLADARSAELMSGMALSQILNVVYRRFTSGITGTGAPLYFMIDEAARLKERINYEEVLSVSRSAKVGVCLAAQDVNQFGDVRQQNAILSNCLTFIALRGASPDTAKYLSSRLGQRYEQVTTVSRSRGPFEIFSQKGRNSQTTPVAVLGEREIMHPTASQFCGVIQVAPVSGKPFLLDFERL